MSSATWSSSTSSPKRTFWPLSGQKHQARPPLALKSWCLTAAPMSNFLPAFYFGICLSMTLILAALLSSAATVRESQCLTAMVRIGRDWLGGAFCNLGLVPLKCGAGSCFALCLGACTPGEGCPVARPCAARGHFCKRHDPADLLQLRSCILLHLVSFPKVLYTQLSKWGQKGVLICQSNRSDDDSQRIFSHQDNTW